MRQRLRTIGVAYVWDAIDIGTVSFWLYGSHAEEHSLCILFLRRVLEVCINKPLIPTDEVHGI